MSSERIGARFKYRVWSRITGPAVAIQRRHRGEHLRYALRPLVSLEDCLGLFRMEE